MASSAVPLRFAFDLGTNSIGWAIYRLDVVPTPGGPPPTVVELLGSGVRLFDDGRNPKDGRSLAEMRRVPRASRTRRDRFVMRRATLLKQLVAMRLLPADHDERRGLALLDPYELRARGLDQALTPSEIGRALIHVNQRRGFQSNRRADRKTNADDRGKIGQGAVRLQAALDETRCRTFGEFLWRRRRGSDGEPRPARQHEAVRIRLDGQGTKALYAIYPTRAMLLAEFDALMAAQAPHHPAVLTAESIGELRETIFHQRPLKSPAVGKCTFVPNEERLPRALPSVEARRIYEVLNQLRFGDGVNMTGQLTVEQRDLFAATLMDGKNVTIRQLRKTLKLSSDVKISLEEAGKSDLKDFVARSAALQDDLVFGSRWKALDMRDRDCVVHMLVAEDDEPFILQWLQTRHGLSIEAARRAADWAPPEGYGRLGRTATNKILAELRSPDRPTYSKAVERAGWHHSDERDGEIILPLPYYGQVLERHVIGGTGDPQHADEKRFGRFPNPTAHVALNQLRRVVNALERDFGPPAQIVIELARDLKLSQEQKEKARKRNAENRRLKDQQRVKLAEHGQAENGENLLRLRLFEEQARAGGGVAECPFSLKPISLAELFSSEVEVEHLLPYSKTFDDTAANKVVCFRDVNRLKRSKSPHDAFSSLPMWPQIEAAAQGLPPKKRWRFAPDAMQRFESTERDFLTRQLNETRHLSRMARIYLSKACSPDDVYVTTGQLTAMLRRQWGLNAIWRDHNRQPPADLEEGTKGAKARTDHRHHAVDACVIGAIDRRVLQAIAHAAGCAEVEHRARLTDNVAEPFPLFREAVRAAIDKVIVSTKPEHSKHGALHEDTAYGLVANQAEAAVIGNLVYRKPLVDLKANEIDRVRDARLRAELQALIAPFRDDKGRVGDEKGLQAALAAFGQAKGHGTGRDQGVRRVRIGKEKQGVVSIKNRATGVAYKAVIPGENHHIDIVQMRDGSWQGFAATVFDVNQRSWRPEWEAKKLGGKLVMRLHKGDAIEIDDTDGVRRIKTVHRLSPSNGVLYLAPHNEGGALGKRHDNKDDPFRWDFANIGSLKRRHARKVSVNALGKVVAMRSNVNC